MWGGWTEGVYTILNIVGVCVRCPYDQNKKIPKIEQITVAHSGRITEAHGGQISLSVGGLSHSGLIRSCVVSQFHMLSIPGSITATYTIVRTGGTFL